MFFFIFGTCFFILGTDETMIIFVFVDAVLSFTSLNQPCNVEREGGGACFIPPFFRPFFS
jgi:hypothetical protein